MKFTNSKTAQTITLTLLALMMSVSNSYAQFVGGNTNREGLEGYWQVTNHTDSDIRMLFTPSNRVRVVIDGSVIEGTIEVSGNQVALIDPNGTTLEYIWERSENGLTLVSKDGRQKFEMERVHVDLEGIPVNQDRAQDSDEESDSSIPTMGELASVLILENDGTWNGQVLNGKYHLVNPKAGDAIRYYFMNTDEDIYGRRSVEVEAGAVQGSGMAGLLYGFQEDPKQYYMLVVDGEGTIRLFHRTPNGMSEKLSMTPGSDKKVDKGTPVKLKMVEDGKTVSLFVNGKSLGSFSSDDTGQGAIGIAAIGIVDAMFSEFEVDVID